MKSLRDQYQDEFTQARVNLVFRLQEEVDSLILSPRAAIETFSRLTLLPLAYSRDYIKTMTESKNKTVWNIEL